MIKTMLPAIVTAVFMTAASAAIAQEQPPGAFEQQVMQHGGMARTYYTYVPQDKVDTPWAVIHMHGSGSNGKVARAGTGFAFDYLAEEQGGIVVYPEGSDKHWNDCRPDVPFQSSADNVSDVGFLINLKSHLVATYGVDPDRVLLAGMSNGGHMVYRVALERPEAFAAYATFAANLTSDETAKCEPSGTPVNMMVMAGTEDPVSPYEGGVITVFSRSEEGVVRSAEETAAYWADLAGYDAVTELIDHPDLSTDDNSAASSQIWAVEGKPRVRLTVIDNGGHAMPHPEVKFPPFFGATNADINGAKEMWQFFADGFDD